MKIKDLRSDAKKIALIFAKKEKDKRYFIDRPKNIEEIDLFYAFNWNTTGKRSQIWFDIYYKGDYREFDKKFVIKNTNEKNI